MFLLLIFSGLIWFGTKNSWTAVFQNPEIRFAVRFTLKTTIIATLGASFTAIPCGYILARQSFPGKVLVDMLLDLPIILPPLISGVALLILFGPFLGNKFANLGINIVFSPWGVVIAQWFIALPFAVRMFRESFAGVDPRYENIARTLGCSPRQVFLRVTLPMARRGIWAGIAMTWARTLGEFGATAMVAGTTRMKTETLAIAVFLNMSIGELQLAISLSLVMFLAAMVILLLFKTLVYRKVEDE